MLRVAAGEVKRLIVSMPPRHGKSEMTSRFTPAWFLGRNPDSRVILASYGEQFASSWGAKARDVLAVHGPAVFGVNVRAERAAANDWGIEGHEGGMICAGVGGQITGRGADLLVIDDPVKNAEEANSQTYRDKAWEWFRSTSYVRLEPGGRIVVVMTRWHEDDLGGRILAHAQAGGEAWHILSLPALDAEGNALWPWRFPADELDRIRYTIGSRVWQAEYQGSPAPPEGGLFKSAWFPRKPAPAAMKWICQAWDTAIKAGEANDYSACVTVGFGDDGLYHLLDVWRGRLEAPELKAKINAKYVEWRPKWIAVEDSAVATAIIQLIVREEHVPVVPVKCDKDKVTRAQGIAPYCEQGKVVLPQVGASWMGEFMDEMGSFPYGAHDDQVDAFVHCLARAVGGGEINARGIRAPSAREAREPEW